MDPDVLPASAGAHLLAAELASLNRELGELPAHEVVARALAFHDAPPAISFSGAEDVLLLEYAKQSGLDFCVFTLDTGRLHPETYRYLDTVARHYDVGIEVVFPQAEAVQGLVRTKGLFSFYEDGHQECCGIRKVEPLTRYLADKLGWMTGQRRDQNPDTRSLVPLVEADPRFVGAGGASLLKWNPLANLTGAQVWAEIHRGGVPFNPLHSRGFVSIGCEPCSRPVLPGQHEREGRWWWEHSDKKECGLHRK